MPNEYEIKTPLGEVFRGEKLHALVYDAIIHEMQSAAAARQQRLEQQGKLVIDQSFASLERLSEEWCRWSDEPRDLPSLLRSSQDRRLCPARQTRAAQWPGGSGATRQSSMKPMSSDPFVGTAERLAA